MGEDTTQIRKIEADNQARLIALYEKLGVIVVVGVLAIAGMYLGVIDRDVMHVLLPYLGLRAGESALRGPASVVAEKMRRA